MNLLSVVIASKMDLPESKENLAKFKEKYPNLEVYPISSVYNEGLDALIKRLGEIVEESDNQAPSITTTEKITKRFASISNVNLELENKDQ